MFWENYVKLCTKAGKSPNAIASELEISSAAVTKWKKGAIPHDTTLQKIADYFEVPIDQLKSETIATTAFSAIAKQISETVIKEKPLSAYGLKTINKQRHIYGKHTKGARPIRSQLRAYDSSKNISAEEQELLNLFRSADKEEQDKIIRYLIATKAIKG